MVELDRQKETLVMDQEEANISSLREERQRTGRYIAVGTAIFLSLLGLYQAVVRGTPQYAALFAPALIMFIYILWILNASANQRKALLAAAAASPRSELDSVVETEMDNSKHKHNAFESTKVNSNEITNNKMASNLADTDEPATNESRIIYSRSYSIA